MRTIETPCGRGVIVDDDANLPYSYRWVNHHLVVRCRDGTSRPLSHDVLELHGLSVPPGHYCCYLDCDPRNCQFDNLIILDRSDCHLRNRKRPGREYVGVYRNGNKFAAMVRYRGTLYYFGLFGSEYEAALARDHAIKVLSPTGRLNLPDEECPAYIARQVEDRLE